MEALLMSARRVLYAVAIGSFLLVAALMILRAVFDVAWASGGWVVPIIGVFGVLAAVSAAMAYLSRPLLERQRTKNMSVLADSLGMKFSDEGPKMIAFNLSQFDLFRHGRDRRLRNLMRGKSDDVEIMVFDYHYHPFDKSDSDALSSQTVVCLSSAGLNLPKFQEDLKGVRREGYGDRLICYEDSKLVLSDRVRVFLDEAIDVMKSFKTGESAEEKPPPGGGQ